MHNYIEDGIFYVPTLTTTIEPVPAPAGLLYVFISIHQSMNHYPKLGTRLVAHTG
jgi:hypothetical protein